MTHVPAGQAHRHLTIYPGGLPQSSTCQFCGNGWSAFRRAVDPPGNAPRTPPRQSQAQRFAKRAWPPATGTHNTGELLSLDGAVLLESSLDNCHFCVKRFFCDRRDNGDPRMSAEPSRAGAIAPERASRSVTTR